VQRLSPVRCPSNEFEKSSVKRSLSDYCLCPRVKYNAGVSPLCIFNNGNEFMATLARRKIKDYMLINEEISDLNCFYIVDLDEDAMR
jgi:hypothetical protein